MCNITQCRVSTQICAKLQSLAFVRFFLFSKTCDNIYCRSGMKCMFYPYLHEACVFNTLWALYHKTPTCVWTVDGSHVSSFCKRQVKADCRICCTINTNRQCCHLWSCRVNETAKVSGLAPYQQTWLCTLLTTSSLACAILAWNTLLFITTVTTKQVKQYAIARFSTHFSSGIILL